MPSMKPRLAVLVTPAVIAALDDLADASGKARSTVAAELLAEIAPQLHDTARFLRSVKAGNKQAARKALQDMVGASLAQVMEAAQPDLFKTKARK